MKVSLDANRVYSKILQCTMLLVCFYHTPVISGLNYPPIPAASQGADDCDNGPAVDFAQKSMNFKDDER